jgi:hypothetical protein
MQWFSIKFLVTIEVVLPVIKFNLIFISSIVTGILLLHFPGGTEKNHEKHHSG